MPLTEKSIRISLTQFTNFALKSGPEQLTAVRAIKQQHAEPYSPLPDPYKRFREGVIRIHKAGLPKNALDAIVDSQTDPNKVEDYPELVRGYKTFWGRKKLTWFSPPTGVWSFADLDVSAKPELGLIADGDKLLIKMYPNKPRDLDKRKSTIVTHVMRLAIPTPSEDVQSCILDVRKGKLFGCDGVNEDTVTILRAQAKSFVEMYRRL